MFNKEITKYVNKNFKTIFIYLLIVVVVTMILFCFDNQNERNNNNLKKNNIIQNIIKNKQNVSKSKVWDNNNKNNIKNKFNNQLNKLQSNKVNNNKFIENFTSNNSENITNVKIILSVEKNIKNKTDGFIKSLVINTRKTDKYNKDIIIEKLLGETINTNIDGKIDNFDELISSLSNLSVDNISINNIPKTEQKKLFYYNLIKKNNKRCFDFHLNLSDGILLQLDFLSSFNPNDSSETSNNNINVNAEIIETTNKPKIIKNTKDFKSCNNLINSKNINIEFENNKEPTIDNILYQNNLIEVNKNIKKIKFTNCGLSVKGDNSNILELKLTNDYKLDSESINEIIDNFNITNFNSSNIKNTLKSIIKDSTINKPEGLILTQSITLNLVFNNNISEIINNIEKDVSRFIQLVNLENSEETDSNTHIEYELKTNDDSAFGNNGIIIKTLLFPEDIRINYKSLLNYVQNKITNINNEYLNDKYVDLLVPIIETDNKLLKNELKLNNYLNKTRFDKLTDTRNSNMKWYNTH